MGFHLPWLKLLSVEEDRKPGWVAAREERISTALVLELIDVPTKVLKGKSSETYPADNNGWHVRSLHGGDH